MAEHLQVDVETPDVFPFPFTPYPIQREFMINLYNAIQNKKFGIFESPTGTGKSLSIICGALKWLKDFNESSRTSLLNEISRLEAEKTKLAADTTDWLSSQTRDIELTRKLTRLKLEQNKILEYDKKIEKMTSGRNRTNVKFRKPNESKSVVKTDEVEEEENIDEEDILLEDVVPEFEEDSEDEDTEDKFEPVKIYICSRTHSQLSQFVGEIIKSPYGKETRTASLASRQNYCINSKVKRLKSSSLLNERCLEMQKKQNKSTKSEEGKTVKRQKGSSAHCQYYKQQNIDNLRDLVLSNVLDIEDLVSNAKEFNACPYYASRKAAEDAQIVLVPYNTLLHKATREANGIKIKNNVVIIDEAHNLLEALAQMYGASVSFDQLRHAQLQLKCYKQKYSTRFSSQNLLCINQLIFITTKLLDTISKSPKQSLNDVEIFTIQKFVWNSEIDNYNMFKLVKFCKDSKIFQKLRGFAIKHPCAEEVKVPIVKGVKDFLSSIENKQKNKLKKEKTVQPTQEPVTPASTPPSNPLLPVIAFLESLTYACEDGRILIQRTGDQNQWKLQFLLLNPASNFKELVQEARSIIVAGGTMKPNSEFVDRLFASAGASVERILEFSCDHIIPPENILPIALTKGPNGNKLLFNFENRFAMAPSLKTIILETCKKVKGGIVVFFPSYKYEAWFWQQIQGVDFRREVFREPQDSGAVEGVLNSFAKVVKNSKFGALLFSVVGGKLSEGLNFSDDLGRCVIVVGMPYANIKAVDLKEKMAYLDKMEGAGAGQKFYEGLCFKAINQCIGRAVRHRNDYATVILVDERYNKAGVQNALPNWIKRSLRTCEHKECFELIGNFFKNRSSE